MVVISRYFDQVRISNAKISCYRETYPDRPTEEAKKKREENLTRGVFNGYMSDKTKIKAKEYVHNWIGSVEHFFRHRKKYQPKSNIIFNLVTLTLPCDQNHTDQQIKTQALKPFIHQLQRIHHVQNYFWVAEAHNSGNIHFHMIIDKWVDHRQLRDLWNSYMQTLGYIDDYRHAQEYAHRDGFHFRANLANKWKYGDQLEAYLRGKSENWQNPNSTDIHRLRKIRNVAAYLTKYLTKSTSKRPIEGRLWGCSDKLRDIKAITLPLGKKLKSVFQQLADEKGSNVFSTDFNWTIWRFDRDTLYDRYPVLAEIWSNFNRHCIRQLYPKLLARDFFDSLAPPVRQAQLELVEISR